jgi:hypothetical protein
VEEKAKEGSPRMKAAIKWARKNAAKEQEDSEKSESPAEGKRPGLFIVH